MSKFEKRKKKRQKGRKKGEKKTNCKIQLRNTGLSVVDGDGRDLVGRLQSGRRGPLRIVRRLLLARGASASIHNSVGVGAWLRQCLWLCDDRTCVLVEPLDKVLQKIGLEDRPNLKGWKHFVPEF